MLKAVAQSFPRNHGLPFRIICGTSAGAINATALACYASCFHLGVRRLEWVWRRFHSEQVYRSDLAGVSGHLLRVYLNRWQSPYAHRVPVSLLDNRPLRGLVNEVIDFSRIDRNILRGHLRAVSVTASSFSSGRSISFFQSAADIGEWQRAKRCGQRSLINTQHLLASSAIPFIFPSVRINQSYYGDGSVHQLAPLSAPIHLGADKIFVVGVERKNRTLASEEHLTHHPGASEMAGHLLDSIFADTLQSDLERLHRINATLTQLPDAKASRLPLKPIQTLLLNPSHDFNTIAAEHYQRLPGAIKLLLRTIGIKRGGYSSVLSYLLFETSYCQELIQLGFADTLARRDEVIDFLTR